MEPQEPTLWPLSPYVAERFRSSSCLSRFIAGVVLYELLLGPFVLTSALILLDELMHTFKQSVINDYVHLNFYCTTLKDVSAVV